MTPLDETDPDDPRGHASATCGARAFPLRPRWPKRPAAVEEGATTAPGELVIRVEVPADAKPGQQLRVTLPSGKQALVAVPAQAAPGTCLRVTVRVDDDADDEADAPAAAPAADDEAPSPPPAATGDADAPPSDGATPPPSDGATPPPAAGAPASPVASASPKPLFSFAPPANAPAMERETSSGTADALAALAALSAAGDEGADGGPLWVSCDECGKWRRVAELPPADGLPWTCAMNLDEAHNACSIPQELPDDEVDRQMARYHARQSSAGALMGGAASIMGGAEPLDRPIVLEAAAGFAAPAADAPGFAAPPSATAAGADGGAVRLHPLEAQLFGGGGVTSAQPKPAPRPKPPPRRRA